MGNSEKLNLQFLGLPEIRFNPINLLFFHVPAVLRGACVSNFRPGRQRHGVTTGIPRLDASVRRTVARRQDPLPLQGVRSRG